MFVFRLLFFSSVVSSALDAAFVAAFAARRLFVSSRVSAALDAAILAAFAARLFFSLQEFQLLWMQLLQVVFCEVHSSYMLSFW